MEKVVSFYSTSYPFIKTELNCELSTSHFQASSFLLTIIIYLVQVPILCWKKGRLHLQRKGTWAWPVRHETIQKKKLHLLLNAVQDALYTWEQDHKDHWSEIQAENGKEIFNDITESNYMEISPLLWKTINLYWVKLDFPLLVAKNILKVLSPFRRHLNTENATTRLFTKTICNLRTKNGFLIFTVPWEYILNIHSLNNFMCIR